MTASLDDRAPQPDDVTDNSVETSADSPEAKPALKKKPSVKKTPTTKTAAVRTAAARKPASTGAAAAKTAAKVTAAKSAAAKNAAAKTEAAKTEAAKTAAARSAVNKTAAKATATKTAAAKTAAAKTAAAKAAATKAAKAKAAAEAAEQEASASSPSETAVTPDPAEGKTPARKPAVKKPAAKRAAPVAKSSGTKTTESQGAPAKGASRAKSRVSAEDAAPASEAVNAPLTLSSPAALLTPTAVEETPELPVVADEPVAADESAVDAAAAVATIASADEDAPATDAIVIRGLVKNFGDQRAVNEIDLTVRAGSFYGIVGPNGAGKTTTLSILAGLLRANAGEVIICGIDQATDPLAAKRVMGVLPDRLRTFDRLTGRQLLHYYGLLRGLSADVIEKRTTDLARAFDLVDALSRVVSDYSAGMTKKIMLAGAMIHSPRVLVLDEPFEAVDPVSSAVILDILRAYVAHGGTVILSSHGMDLVERVCSRVAIIVDGNVLAEGTIDDVRAGQTLEARFVELSGGLGEVEGLEWLHTFSD